MSNCCRYMPSLAATLAGTSPATPSATPDVHAPVMNSEAAIGSARREVPRTVDEVIDALYAGVSGPAELTRDWSAFARLFLPNARIGVTSVTEGDGVAIQLMDVAEFGGLNDRASSGRGFFESEIHREQSGFGDVLHVWSAYEARRSPSEAPYARGANSLQMVRTPDDWRIAALARDHERSGLLLAGRFPVAARARETSR